MLWLIIKKEVLDHLLSLKFSITCILCFVVILSSVIVLSRDYKENLMDYHTNIVMHRNEVLSSGQGGQAWKIFEGIKVDKPLNAMEIFFRNPNRKGNITARVRAGDEPRFESEYEENPIIHLFSIIDLRYFIGIIMGLLAIIFSYDAVSGEKEAGTLRLVVSYSVPRDKVLLGKWIGGYLSLIFPYLLAIISGLIIAIVSPQVKLSGANWLELGMIILLSFLYISAMYTMGLFISANTKMASTSITILLLIWVIVVLVIPNISPYLASQIFSTPSIQEIEKEKMQMAKAEGEKFHKEWKKYNEECEKKKIPQAERWEGFQDRHNKWLSNINSEREKINTHYKRLLNKQVKIAKNISRISPLSSLNYSIVDLAGVGSIETDRFWKELVRYRDKVSNYILGNRPEWMKKNWKNIDFSDYPKFHYEESKFSDRIRDCFPDILVLIMWNVIFFMGAYLSFLRYDVR
ncbi:MAG: ABC transporter permease [Candidatus Omnitrophica bacterium]|nr:ABC transporter permease [Candidatus Omnitrophota bacterium]